RHQGAIFEPLQHRQRGAACGPSMVLPWGRLSPLPRPRSSCLGRHGESPDLRVWVPPRLLRSSALGLEWLHVTHLQRGLISRSKGSTPGSDRLVPCLEGVATYSVRSREFDRHVRSVHITRTATGCADTPSAVP